MSYQTENTYELREKRVQDTVALKEPDRIPFAPKCSLVYAQAAGINNYDAMNDFRLMKPGVQNFLTRYESDLFWSPACYPINVMETLGTTAVRWPGATCGIELDQSFQIVDDAYMQEDEYDEFLRNPSHFFMTKLFPRKHKKLQGLSKLSFGEVIEFGHYASMQAFADPEVRNSLLTLMQAGEEVAKWQTASQELNKTALEMQTPLGTVIGQPAPYDMLADNIRGYLNVPMDLFEIPEKVLASIDIMTELAMKNVKMMQQAGIKYCFMPLHGGTDDFMSNETYATYYWPSLIKVINYIVELGITPYIFWEGKYSNRMEFLKKLPKGKCISMFEQVDLARVKKEVGDITCIAGNLPSTLLIFGKKQEVIDETKRLIDTCAPGGGFIMDCSIVLDHYKEENMDAWYETTLKYG